MKPRSEPPRVTILCGDLGPEASVASALALARWLHREQGGTKVDVIGLWGGPWRSAFEAVAEVHVVNDDRAEHAFASRDSFDLDGVVQGDDGRGTVKRLCPADAVPALLRDLKMQRLADGVKGALVRRRLGRGASPIWLAGASAARLLHYVPRSRPVVAHQSEFGPLPAEHTRLTNEDLAVLAARPDRWITGGDDAKSALGEWGVKAPVEVIPDLLLLDEEQPDCSAVRARLAVEHGISPEAPLVASGGAIDWWEVPDSFVQVAWNLHRRPGYEDVRFLWLGEHSTQQMLWPLRHDIRHAGLEGIVHIADYQSAPSPLLTCADAVVLTRRGQWAPTDLRDLEAVATGVARWALPGESPGMQGATAIVSPLDDRAMADAVVRLLGLSEDGSARRRARGTRQRHTARQVGPEILRILRNATC